jgi:Cu(I)/Ag(I) efflux system membrane protein CusA/SilA
VFTLQAQEGRLFGPLAFTKTYAMAAAAALSVTLIPVLMGWWIRGRIPDERRNPITPRADRGLPAGAGVGAALAPGDPAAGPGGGWPPRPGRWHAWAASSCRAWTRATCCTCRRPARAVGAAKASELLQQTDRMIRTVPEVERVFGKAGRAETATDPAPLEMFETTIQLKPRDQWRPGMTPDRLVEELDAAVKVPGLANIWIPPIRNRIDMLATGIKSPIGVKVTGSDLAAIDRIAQEVERWRQGRAGRVARRWPSA